MQAFVQSMKALSGPLLLTGLSLALLVILVPQFIPFSFTWKYTYRMVIFTDYGLSTASIFIGTALCFFGWAYWPLAGLLFLFSYFRVFRILR